MRKVGQEDFLDIAEPAGEVDILRFGQVLATDAEDRPFVKNRFDPCESRRVHWPGEIGAAAFRTDDAVRERNIELDHIGGHVGILGLERRIALDRCAMQVADIGRVIEPAEVGDVEDAAGCPRR